MRVCPWQLAFSRCAAHRLALQCSCAGAACPASCWLPSFRGLARPEMQPVPGESSVKHACAGTMWRPSKPACQDTKGLLLPRNHASNLIWAFNTWQSLRSSSRRPWTPSETSNTRQRRKAVGVCSHLQCNSNLTSVDQAENSQAPASFTQMVHALFCLVLVVVQLSNEGHIMWRCQTHLVN